MVLFAADFCFEEGKGGMSLKQSGCEGDQSSGNKTIKLSRDKSVGHLSYWPIDVKDFFNVKFALANYSIIYCSDEGLMLEMSAF